MNADGRSTMSSECDDCREMDPRRCERCPAGRAAVEADERARGCGALLNRLEGPTMNPALFAEVFTLARAVAPLVAELPFSLTSEVIAGGCAKPVQGGLF